VAELVLVQNWFEELKRLSPGREEMSNYQREVTTSDQPSFTAMQGLV